MTPKSNRAALIACLAGCLGLATLGAAWAQEPKPVKLNTTADHSKFKDLQREFKSGPDLTKVVAAYNMGPGALQRWLAAVGGFTDPLLMIESIPKDETRTYVKRVLTNMWLYESRYGMASPTLEAMAAGRAPIYSSAARVS